MLIKEVNKMQPAQRKLKILEAIVDAYVGTGEPVGSKSICDSLDFSVSSATVRNDMAELSDIGLLAQPHTSSGRVPTNLGYRLYIDKLMPKSSMSVREQAMIRNSLKLHADDPEHLLSEASQLLSEITGFASVVTSPPSDDAYIRQIKLVQTGRHTAMVVLITSMGMVKNRLFRCDYVLTSELLEVLDNALNDKLCGISVADVTPAFIQSTAISLGELSMLLPNVLIAVQDAAKDASSMSITLEGQMNLLSLPEFSFENAMRIMEFLSHTVDMEKLLNNPYDGTAVLIGEENNVRELKESSVIISRYYLSDNCSGTMAVIGPTRMDYSRIIAGIEYLASMVGTLLRELLNG